MSVSHRRAAASVGLAVVALAAAAACKPANGGGGGFPSSFPSGPPTTTTVGPSGTGTPTTTTGGGTTTTTTGGGTSTTTTTTTTTTTPPTTTTDPGRIPNFTITTEMSGLDHPWDIVAAPDGTLLTGNRAGGFVAKHPNGTTGPVTADLSDLYAASETGVMGIELSRAFPVDRTLWTCQGKLGSPNSIQVVSWTMNAGFTAMTRTGVVVPGIPTLYGRHGGCRVRDLGDGSLLISTGDAAYGPNPEDINSLAGKTLRVSRANGQGWPGNPFIGKAGDDRIYTYGHRNVQGLALRASTGKIYAIEQGTYRDDEVNLLAAGNDYGYNPDNANVPNRYDESVPMTRAGGTPAVWSSGNPTVATNGGAFTTGAAWGKYQDWLAVGVLKGKSLMFLQLPANGGAYTAEVDPPALQAYGRIRSVTNAADGSLLITTDNGNGADKVLRVTPS